VTEFASSPFIHCGRSSANARIGGLLTDMLLVMGNPGRSRQLSALVASAAILLSLSALPICRPYTYEQDGMQHPFLFAATVFPRFSIQQAVRVHNRHPCGLKRSRRVAYMILKMGQFTPCYAFSYVCQCLR
jgi:hypothetical protein